MAALLFFFLLLLLHTLLHARASDIVSTTAAASSPSRSFSSVSASEGASPASAAENYASDIHSQVRLQIAGSVLSALLESPFTDFMELVDRAAFLQPLESVVEHQNITIFAPANAFLEELSEFRSFLVEPGNAECLRRVLQYHVLLGTIMAADWANASIQTFSQDRVLLSSGEDGSLRVDRFTVGASDLIVSHDGVVHAINGLLIPKAVQNLFFFQRKRQLLPLALLPQPSPKIIDRAENHLYQLHPTKAAAASKFSEEINFPTKASNFSEEMDSLDDLAPAPTSAPHHAYGWVEVDGFVSSLVKYGGYSEMADLLVNLTSFAWDLANLVNDGYKLTLLAPNDHAIAHLTAEHLAASGAIEEMLMYHVLTEYQTEESLYNTVRRSGKAMYGTLRLPHKLTAMEAEGTVQFGDGESEAEAAIYDPDIFVDGHISVQGINGVLFPPT